MYPTKYLPLDEKHPSDTEVSYGYSKFAGEELLNTFTRSFGIRTYITRPAWILNAEMRPQVAKSLKPATQWQNALWGWVPSEDMGELHRLLMEKADDLPLHDIFVANAHDTRAVEPSMELIEKFRPDLLEVTTPIEGRGAFMSTQHAYESVGWEPHYLMSDYFE